MGGLFPLKSRQPDEIARKKGKKAHTKKDQEEDEEDPDPEANLIEDASQYPFANIKICLAPVRDS
jgi:hypothetical protein